MNPWAVVAHLVAVGCYGPHKALVAGGAACDALLGKDCRDVDVFIRRDLSTLLGLQRGCTGGLDIVPCFQPLGSVWHFSDAASQVMLAADGGFTLTPVASQAWTTGRNFIPAWTTANGPFWANPLRLVLRLVYTSTKYGLVWSLPPRSWWEGSESILAPAKFLPAAQAIGVGWEPLQDGSGYRFYV